MEWLNLMPLPVALGMVIYTNYRIEQHEKNCSIRELVEHIKDKQSDIDGKINLILERLMR